MISFLSPLQFLWTIPWAVLLFIVYSKQSRSIGWIKTNVSVRFQYQFSRYSGKTLKYHFIFLFFMGLFLIISAAAPVSRGSVEIKEETGNIILLIDSSFSMLASDTRKVHSEKPKNRFAQAKEFAVELVTSLPEYSFGLITFSGIAAVHSPPMRDTESLKTFIENLPLHNFEHTGSHFKSAFQSVIHQVIAKPGNYQVVLISDGEIPKNQKMDFEEELNIFQNKDVPVHCVGIGTKKGGSVRFYVSYFQMENTGEGSGRTDLAGTVKRETRTKTVTNIDTYRTDEYMEKISSKTDGEYIVVENKKWIDNIIPALKKNGKKTTYTNAPGKQDLSVYPIFLFLLFFVIETLFLFRNFKFRRNT
ncbi:MAG: VWA domain-containing protein [Leptospira sp.]|nr:VWA domain-containing protein [Leptospira sp.]